MSRNTNLSKLKTSWTKYDIVQVMDVIDSLESIESYKKKEIVIDEPILKSFLGIKTLRSPTPPHWIEVQKYPAEKKLFAFLAVMFTHYEVVKLFAEHYSQKPMGGTFKMEHGKMFTNIRSALVESGATLSNYRRHNEVPFDFSMIFGNGAVGVLFKEVLKERLNRVDDVASDADFIGYVMRMDLTKH